ncbi:MAG: hypothetical protein ACOCZ5_02740 [bacterium]
MAQKGDPASREELASIVRSRERTYRDGYEVTVNELPEGNGMIEVRVRDENGDYFYKHLCIGEIRKIVLEDYDTEKK